MSASSLFPGSSLSPRCQELAQPSIPNFIVSIFLVVGILISYLPQHIRIVSRRSSEGLSPYFVLLGTVSGTFGIANVLTLPASREDIQCCRHISSFACTAGLLGIAQIGMQWTCFFVILLLFILFFPRTPAPSSNGDLVPQRSPRGSPRAAPQQPSYRTAVVAVAVSMTHLFLVLFISVVLFAAYPAGLKWWAWFLGIMAGTLACVQYFPQIYTTWMLQDVKSLSVTMMLFQVPGSVVLASSLAYRSGWAGVTTWGVYIITGLLQSSLLAMALWFQWRGRRSRRPSGESTIGASLDRSQMDDETDDEGGPVERPSRRETERTPLLGRQGQLSREGSVASIKDRVKRSLSARKFSERSASGSGR